MTLNNLIDILAQYASRHLQINGFGRGDLAELEASAAASFPIMWVSIAQGVYSRPVMQYTIQLLFADLIYEDKKNELEVQSDMLLVGLDTVAFLLDNPDFDFKLNDDITIDFFTDRFTSLAAGCVLTLSLRDPKPLDRCVIPLS